MSIGNDEYPKKSHETDVELFSRFLKYENFTESTSRRNYVKIKV